MTFLSADYLYKHCACEGSEQRFVSTGMAAGVNEIKQHRNFSEMHFTGVATSGFFLDGHEGSTVWNEAVPMYVTRLGELVEKLEPFIKKIFTDNVAFVPRYPLR